MFRKVKRTKYGFLIFLFAALLMFSSGVTIMPVSAWAAEEQEESSAEPEEEVLPKGPQNELEIRAAEEGVSWPVGPDALWSDKAILIDLDTGVALYEKNADAQDYPASTTKIMTAMLVLENASMDDVVTFSADAVNNTEGSGIWRMEGEQLTVEQCMYALMLASANECAYALAEHVTGGDHDAFVQMMNDRAALLGCTNTHFTNPNGLPDEEHVTTARDLAKIARAAYQNETFRQIAGTEEYRIPATNMQDEEVLMYNHHKMICGKKTDQYLYEPATAGKTGYTKAALHTLVTFAEQDGHRLACVVLRSRGDAQYTETQALFEYGFANFSNVNIKENETRLDQAALTEGYTVPEGKEVTDVQIDPEAMLTLPNGVTISDVTPNVVYTTADDGSQTGEVIYTYGGNEVGRTAILVSTKESKEILPPDTSSAGAESVHTSEDSSLSDQVKALVAELGMTKTLIGIAILVAIVLIIVFSVRRAYRRHKQKKILSKVKQTPAPVLEDVENLDVENIPETLEHTKDASEPEVPELTEDASEPEVPESTEDASEPEVPESTEDTSELLKEPDEEDHPGGAGV